MSKKEKTYRIKIPVYSSELLKDKKGLFNGHTYKDMIAFLDRKLKLYNENKPKLSKKKRNKVKEIEIQNIEKIESVIGEVPVRLFKISAYNTNLIDGYVETKEKITLTKDDKLGSETNFMLLYPRIIGLDEEVYQYQWKILLYEDPSKENRELVSICKTVLEKVFEIKVCNIKLDRVLKLLKDKKIISELSMQFNSQTNDENEVETNFKQYLVNSRLKKIKLENFEDIPFESVESLINDTEYENEYQKRVLKFIFKNKEIKITNEYVEAKEIIKDTVEEIFNSEIKISESEIDSLFKTEYIMEKMSPVIQEYLSENE